MSSGVPVMVLRYYPPEKQGLRLHDVFCCFHDVCLRYYPPEKQGLRQFRFIIHHFFIYFSDTILQKNKD